MNQCQECGALVTALKNHYRSSLCQKEQTRNSKGIFKCRNCGDVFEKAWHLDHHMCTRAKVEDPLVLKLRLKCKMYKQEIKALISSIKGVQSTSVPNVSSTSVSDVPVLNVPPVPDVPFSNVSIPLQSVEVKREIPTVPTKVSEPPKRGPRAPVTRADVSKEPPRQEAKRSDVPKETLTVSEIEAIEAKRDFKEKKEQIKNLVDLLIKKERYDNGVDRFYLLGEKAYQFVSDEILSNPEYEVVLGLLQISPIMPLIKASNPISEILISGISDSGSNYNYVAFILLTLGLYDISLIKEDISIQKELSNYMEGVPLEKQFTPSYTMSPISKFVTEIVVNRVCFANDMYFVKDEKGWRKDPHLVGLSASLSGALTNQIVKMFKEIYKDLNGDNKYNEKWKMMMENFMILFHNLEVLLPVFDFGHLMRKIGREKSKGDVPIHSLEESDQLQNEFSLQSTRINFGIPAVEAENIYNVLFTSTPIDVQAGYLKKYLSRLSKYKEEYKAYSMFRLMVSSEAENYSHLK